MSGQLWLWIRRSSVQRPWLALGWPAVTGFLVVAVLLAVPYPRAPVQVEMLGLDPKLLTVSAAARTYRFIPAADPVSVTDSADGRRIRGPAQGIHFEVEGDSASITMGTTGAAYVLSLNARVQDAEGPVTPLWVEVYDTSSPEVFVVAFVEQGRGIHARAGRGGRYIVDDFLGHYDRGAAYSVELEVSPGPDGHIALRIPEIGVQRRYDAVPVARSSLVSLAVGSNALGGRAIGEVTAIRTVAPDQPYHTYVARPGFVSNVVRPAIVMVLALTVACSGVVLWRRRTTLREGFTRMRRLPIPLRSTVLILVVVALVAGVYFALAPFSGHPYDLFGAKLWSYVLSQYGLSVLYPLSSLLPSGEAFGLDRSMVNVVMSYPPLPAYVLKPVGLLYSAVSPDFVLSSRLLTLLVKAPWILMSVTGGALVFIMVRDSLREQGRESEVRWVPATQVGTLGLVMVLDTALWGQFEGVAILGYAVAAMFALRRRPGLAFVALLLTMSLKQAPIVMAPLVALLIVSRSGLRDSLRGLGIGLFACAVIWLPALWAGYTPRFIFNITMGQNVLNVLSLHPTGVPDWANIVGYGTYNVWPIVTVLFDGASGWGRYTVQALREIPWIRIDYHMVGTGLALAALLALLGVTLRWRDRVLGTRLVFLCLALAVLSVYTFMTGVHERFLAYALLPLALSYPVWHNRRHHLLLFGALAVLLGLSLLGTLALTSEWYPNASPDPLPRIANPGRFWQAFLTNDRLISFLSGLELVAYLSLWTSFVALARTGAKYVETTKHCTPVNAESRPHSGGRNGCETLR